MIDDTYPPLAAWLHDERVAELAFDGVRGVQLTYTATAIERFGLNGLALSASLPVRREPYGPAPLRIWTGSCPRARPARCSSGGSACRAVTRSTCSRRSAVTAPER